MLKDKIFTNWSTVTFGDKNPVWLTLEDELRVGDVVVLVVAVLFVPCAGPQPSLEIVDRRRELIGL